MKKVEKLNIPLKLGKKPQHYQSYLHGLHPLHSWVMSILYRGNGTFGVQSVWMIFKMISTHILEKISSELTAKFLKILYITWIFFQNLVSTNSNCRDKESAPWHKGSNIFACFLQSMVIPYLPCWILGALKKSSSPNTAAEIVLAAASSHQHSETESSVKHLFLNS